ncbi:hypothetical protein F5Y01DRAFT_238588 [Xylaria sp. FL0043]|nr:hypothetical protein F5Y01DRAFT_238588 [Xylaria sp. FL0043]
MFISEAFHTSGGVRRLPTPVSKLFWYACPSPISILSGMPFSFLASHNLWSGLGNASLFSCVSTSCGVYAHLSCILISQDSGANTSDR